MQIERMFQFLLCKAFAEQNNFVNVKIPQFLYFSGFEVYYKATIGHDKSFSLRLPTTRSTNYFYSVERQYV